MSERENERFYRGERLFTPSEIATEFKVSRSSVVRWLKQDDLHGIKIKKRWVVPETSLRMFIEKSTGR